MILNIERAFDDFALGRFSKVLSLGLNGLISRALEDDDSTHEIQTFRALSGAQTILKCDIPPVSGRDRGNSTSLCGFANVALGTNKHNFLLLFAMAQTNQ
jgi:hypothetical protein